MSTKQQSAERTRTRLVDAAMATIHAQGLVGLTLDGVAKAAGVSKGGLLHHYPSKDALVEAILRRLFADFEARVGHYLEREPAAPGRSLRAYVRATFDEDPLPLELGAVLLVAAAENEALLRLIREDASGWQRRFLDDGVPPARAAVIRQAADASWSERLLGVAPADRADRLAVMEELLKLTEVDRP